MSWDIAVRGVLSFDDAKDLAKWPARKLRPVALPESLPQAELECATVGAALKMLAKRATYSRTTTKKKTWTLWAVLSEDDYLDHTPTLVAAMAAAGALSATGEVLLYGYVTAPAGIAHRLEVGPTLDIAKLTKAAEKKLLATPDAKAFERWVETQVEADEEVETKARVKERSATPSKFFADMKEVRPVIEDAMDFIQRANDAALVKVVAKGGFYRFYAKTFKTGRIIKNACTPAAQKFDDPAGAASDMLGIVAALDPAAAEALCARLIDAADMPDELRKISARVLHRTPHARRMVERLAFRSSGISEGLTQPWWWLTEWAGYLADSSDVPTELLGERLRAALPLAKKDGGAAQLVHYLATALLAKREAWAHVPELAKARWEHPDATVRATIAQILAKVVVPVPIEAPALDVLALQPEDAGYPLIYELCRRLRIDPSRAFDELAPLIAAQNGAAANAVASVLGPSQTWRKSVMTPAEQNAVFEAEPRWKKIRIGM